LHSLLLQVAVLRCVLTLRLVLLVVLLPPRCAPSLLAFHSAACSLVSAEFTCHCSVLIASMQMWHDLLVMALCWLMHGHSSHSSMDLAKASCNGATACRAMSCGMVARRFLQVNVPPPLTQHDMQSRDAQNKCLTCAPSAELRPEANPLVNAERLATAGNTNVGDLSDAACFSFTDATLSLLRAALQRHTRQACARHVRNG
jgi:hypothetical protein